MSDDHGLLDRGALEAAASAKVARPRRPTRELVAHGLCFAASLCVTRVFPQLGGGILLAVAVLGGGIALVVPNRTFGVQLLRFGRPLLFGYLLGLGWLEWSSVSHLLPVTTWE